MKKQMQFQKGISFLLVLFLCIFVVSSVAEAINSILLSQKKNNEYIVKLKGEVMGKVGDEDFLLSKQSDSLIVIQHRCFLTKLYKTCASTKILGEFRHVWNGYAIEATQKDIDKIKELEQVESVYLANQYYLQRKEGVETIQARNLTDSLTGNKLCTGKGITVGIIDTGVDYQHGDLGGGIGKDSNGNWYKVKKGFDYSEMSSIPYESGFSNHGTHVAGIVAGNGEPGIAVGQSYGTGISPEANLIVYKVFTNHRDSTGEASILMALEQAVIDDCDVVNLSLGKSFGWSNDPLSLACEKIISKGIIVVASAGNSGERNSTYNQFPVHAPGSGINVLSVASCNDRIKNGVTFFDKDNIEHTVIGHPLTVSTSIKDYDKKDLVVLHNPLSKETLSRIDYKDKILMTQPNTMPISEIEEYLDNTTIGGLILVNDRNYPQISTIKRDILIPVTSIGKSDAEYIIGVDNISSEKMKAAFFYDKKVVTISDFSSQGPTPDFQLKPEITAPGTSILSCITNNQYSYMSGTSMSSPFVAGAASIIKQCRPDFSVEEIRSLLINYADPILNPLTSNYYSIYRQGGGMVNLKASLQGKMTVEPATLSFKEVTDFKTVDFELQNHFETEQKIEIVCKATNKQNIAVTVSPYSYSLKKGEKVKIQVRLEVGSKTSEGFGEFWIEVHSKNNLLLRVPCIFYHGNYPQMQQILRSYMFPTMAISPNGDGSCDENTYNCLSPYNIDGLEVDVFDSDQKYIGNIFYHRGRIGAGYYSIPFFGRICGKKLKDGLYTIKPHVLPVNKDYKNVNNWIPCLSSTVLIDTVPPELTINCKWVSTNEVHISGFVNDNNSNMRVFLTYQVDYDSGGLIQLESDGSFNSIIYLHNEDCFIRFTAQDLAGNTCTIKKRIPFPDNPLFEVTRHYLIMK